MSRIVVAAQAALFVVASAACGQNLVVSVGADVQASDGFVMQEELHRLGGVRTAALTYELLGLCVGDTNQNLVFDDGPADIDAAQWLGGVGPGAFLLSSTANFTAPGGTTVLDGDMFTFGPNGVSVVYSEAMFAAVASATSIDVDAFALGANGEIYFSFAEDEQTTSPALIAQNGGVSLIDEQCVFRLDHGATAAVLHFTQAQVVAFFNSACGTTATSVVDVQGLEMDPYHPGALLMTSASASAAIKGRVITTFGGGQPFFLNGVEMGPGATDFAVTTSLDALAFVTDAPTPVLRALPMVVSVNSPTSLILTASGYAPGETVQLVFTDAVLPRPPFLATPGATGYAATPLDVASPVFAASIAAPNLTRTADLGGRATWSINVQGLPPNVTAAAQAIGANLIALSTPVGVTLLP